jgi:hypothetical protein
MKECSAVKCQKNAKFEIAQARKTRTPQQNKEFIPCAWSKESNNKMRAKNFVQQQKRYTIIIQNDESEAPPPQTWWVY